MKLLFDENLPPSLVGAVQDRTDRGIRRRNDGRYLGGCLGAGHDADARGGSWPLHLQPVFKDCPCYGGAVAERLFDRGLCLPSGSNLSTTDLDRVVEVVRRGFACRKT